MDEMVEVLGIISAVVIVFTVFSGLVMKYKRDVCSKFIYLQAIMNFLTKEAEVATLTNKMVNGLAAASAIYPAPLIWKNSWRRQ